MKSFTSFYPQARIVEEDLPTQETPQRRRVLNLARRINDEPEPPTINREVNNAAHNSFDDLFSPHTPKTRNQVIRDIDLKKATLNDQITREDNPLKRSQLGNTLKSFQGSKVIDDTVVKEHERARDNQMRINRLGNATISRLYKDYEGGDKKNHLESSSAYQALARMLDRYGDGPVPTDLRALKQYFTDNLESSLPQWKNLDELSSDDNRELHDHLHDFGGTFQVKDLSPELIEHQLMLMGYKHATDGTGELIKGATPTSVLNFFHPDNKRFHSAPGEQFGPRRLRDEDDKLFAGEATPIPSTEGLVKAWDEDKKFINDDDDSDYNIGDAVSDSLYNTGNSISEHEESALGELEGADHFYGDYRRDWETDDFGEIVGKIQDRVNKRLEGEIAKDRNEQENPDYELPDLDEYDYYDLPRGLYKGEHVMFDVTPYDHTNDREFPADELTSSLVARIAKKAGEPYGVDPFVTYEVSWQAQPEKDASKETRNQMAFDALKTWRTKVLPSLKPGSILYNDPQGGGTGGNQRERIYALAGFGDYSDELQGQYGLVVKEKGKNKVVPIQSYGISQRDERVDRLREVYELIGEAAEPIIIKYLFE